MNGLLFDSNISGYKKVNPLWTVQQTDILLNLYFSGAWSLMRISVALGYERDVPAIERRIWEFRSNYRDRRLIDYVPFGRHSRVDCRWNRNELLFFSKFQEENKKNEKNIKYLSGIMQRHVGEIKQAWKNKYWPGMRIQARHRKDGPVTAKFVIGNRTSVSAIKSRRLLEVKR